MLVNNYLYKAVETPHQIIGHQIKAAALPVYQHSGVLFKQRRQSQFTLFLLKT
jgi:hypothetical protein